MKKYLLVLIILLLSISLVNAATPITPAIGLDYQFMDNIQSIDYYAPDGLCLAGLEVMVPYGTTVNFVINPGTTTAQTGSIVYSGDSVSSTETITIGSDSKEFYFPGNVLKPASLHHIGVAFNNTGERGYYVDTEILTSYFNQIAYETVANATPITHLTLTSNQLVNLKVITQSYEKGYTDLAPGGIGDLQGLITGPEGTGSVLDIVKDFLTLSYEIGVTLYNLLYNMYYWLKFLFWDNLVITIGLYIGIAGALSFHNAVGKKGAVFIAIRNFFKYQKTFFEFILSMWQRLIDLIATFRGIFRI